MRPLILVTAFIFLHILILFHLRFEFWPEMMVMPYLMKNGFELYRDMIVPWTPGLMWVLQGWFWLAGLTVGNLKLLTWLIIAGTDILVYLIAAKRWGKAAGIISLISFLLLQPLFDGNGLWFDLAIVPFLLLAFYFDNPLFLGPAFLIKQSMIWLMPIFLVGRKKYQILYNVKYLILTILGVFGISSLWFLSRGTLSDYWFWAYDFTFRIFPRMPGHLDLATWRHWVLALVPFVFIGGIRSCRIGSGFAGGKSNPFWWMILSLPFALPRFGLFHFQPAVAFLALEIGKLYKDYKGYNNYKIYLLLGLVAVYLGFFWQRTVKIQWQKPDRFLEPEVYQLAAKVALETDKNQPVLLVNGPELVYVLADRLPPKPWLTQFPWFLELPGFQEKLIEDFKQQNLKQVFITPYLAEGNFVPGSYRPKRLLEYVSKVK